jgi:hypothetical protein
MVSDPRDELSPAEQRAFAELPREFAPSASLEERTVAALRERGVLPTPITAARSRRRSRLGRAWLPVALAASLSIFTSGLLVGNYMGSRNMALQHLVGRESAQEAARHVQRAGSLYVAALAALSTDSTPNRAVRDSVRTVAVKILTEAAEEMALLAPDDPLAAAVLRVQTQRARQQTPDAPSRQVVWY